MEKCQRYFQSIMQTAVYCIMNSCLLPFAALPNRRKERGARKAKQPEDQRPQDIKPQAASSQDTAGMMQDKALVLVT